MANVSTVKWHNIWILSIKMHCRDHKLINGYVTLMQTIDDKHKINFISIASKEIFFRWSIILFNCNAICPELVDILKIQYASRLCLVVFQNNMANFGDGPCYFFHGSLISNIFLQGIETLYVHCISDSHTG